MGTSLGPVAAHLFMVKFENLARNAAISNSNYFPPVWLRYVDDVFVAWEKDVEELNVFVSWLNSLRPSIRFKVEREDNGVLSFLDVTIKKDGHEWSFSVYRKPTHRPISTSKLFTPQARL